MTRIQNPASNDEKITTLTNKQTLIHLIDELERQTQNITKIIAEPLFLSNNFQTFKPSNFQTLEPSNNKQQTRNKQFDLTWNYPVLLWFLAELYEQNIFNFKVKKIIERLTEPLSNESNLPKLQSNRLLLALALTNFQTTVKSSNSQTFEQSSNSQTIVEQLSNLQTAKTNLLDGINRKTINSELPPHNTTLRYSTSGIAWIYQQLHRQIGDNHFKNEMEYWHQLPFESETPYDVFPGINNESLNAWGLLEGLAGMLLNIATINEKEQKKQYNS